jgi:hypothetical protein
VLGSFDVVGECIVGMRFGQSQGDYSDQPREGEYSR